MGWKSLCWSWWQTQECPLPLGVKHLVLFLNVLSLLWEIFKLFYFCAWIFHFLIRILFLFLMWIILKVYIELVTILPLFYVLVLGPAGMWDLDSLTRDWTHTPALEGKILTSEPPGKSYMYIYIYICIASQNKESVRRKPKLWQLNMIYNTAFLRGWKLG